MVKEVYVRRGDNAKQEIYQRVTVSLSCSASLYFFSFISNVH
jgi:hypothetical protein